MTGSATSENAAGKARLRVARFLGEDGAAVRAAADGSRLLLEKAGGALIAAARETVEAMARDALIARSVDKLALSAAGTAMLRRAAAAENPFQAQHRELEEIGIETPAGPAAAHANLAEAPLGLLADLTDAALAAPAGRHRDRGGRAGARPGAAVNFPGKFCQYQSSLVCFRFCRAWLPLTDLRDKRCS